jgi:AbrB family looped-hinge helix DNA binding protein
MSRSTLTAKGQTTVPKDVRDHLGLKPGDRIDFVIEEDGEVRLRTRKVRLGDLAGVLGKPSRALTIEEMNDATADAAVARFNRCRDGAE